MKYPGMLLALTATALTCVSGPAQAALAVGAKAPEFATEATLAGKPFHFELAAALAKGPVVLYFFPAAFTSGCTIEAHDFAEATAEFNRLGATVIGVSRDPIDKLIRFSVSECRNKFAVASADGKLIASYKVTIPLMGMSNRTSYVIAPDGHILLAYSAMDPSGHVRNTMAAVKAWRAAHGG